MVVDENVTQSFVLGIWVNRLPFTELTVKTERIILRERVIRSVFDLLGLK